MISMDYVYADQLLPDQLMEGDLIEFYEDSATEIGAVTKIQESLINGEYIYTIQGRNDFNEPLEIVVGDDDLIKLFVTKIDS